MNWLKLVVIVIVAGLLAQRASAESIELPPEELAKESVLPVFDRPVSVKNRLIVTEGRFDFNVAYMYALSEPIYNSNRVGASLYYHTSEDNAFGLIFAKNNGGLSSYADQLKEKFKLDFDRAPKPESAIMADWNWKMYYGKMSITKAAVLNTHIYSTLAGGLLKFQHKAYPVIAPGLGSKFYFGRQFALRLDLRLQMHQAPIPFLDSNGCTRPGINMSCTTQPLPSHDDFEERLTFTTALDAGLSWLF